MVQVLKKSQPGLRAADLPYEEERAVRVKAARQRAERIRNEIYDNGGWYTDEAKSWRGDTQPGIRVFEDPALFDMVTKAYMELWGIPENNAKDFAEHARTRLPPKMERFLAERKKKQSKPQSPPQWMKACFKSSPPDEASAGPTSPTAAGSGLGAVRALQASDVPEPFSGPTDEQRAAILAEMEACRLKARAEMEARAKEAAEAPDTDPLRVEDLQGKKFDVARAEIAMRDDLSQTEKWAAMGMF